METESQISTHLSEPPVGVQAVRAFYDPRQLVTVAAQCGSRTFDITCHVKAAPNIVRLFEEVTRRGLAGLIHSYDGCFVDRPKRLSSEPSMHSYGAAIDLNASTNEQGTAGNMPPQIVAIAEALGFFWGGNFRGRFRDAMHFQLGTDFPLDGRAAPRLSGLPVRNDREPGAGIPSAPQAVAGLGLLPLIAVGHGTTQHVPAAVKVEAGRAWVRVDALPKIFAGMDIGFDGKELTIKEV